MSDSDNLKFQELAAELILVTILPPLNKSFSLREQLRVNMTRLALVAKGVLVQASSVALYLDFSIYLSYHRYIDTYRQDTGE